MAEPTQTAASLTRRAIEAMDAADTATARTLLAEALTLDWDYERAWTWFAHIAEEDGERRFCLDRAVAANPTGRARFAINRLRNVKGVAPPEVIHLVDPEIPPDILAAPMRTKRPGWFPWVAAAVVVFIIAAAVVTVRLISQEQPIYLAFVGGVTGPIAETTSGMINSVQLHLAEVNADGGVDGHPVELLIFDDESDPDVARQRAEEIVEDGRALAVIGHGNSRESLAAAPVYESAGIPVMTATSTADSVTESAGYFSTVFTNTSQGYFMAAYVQHVLGGSSVTVVAGADEYGRSLADGFLEAHASEETVERIDLITGSDEEITDETIADVVDQIAAGSSETLVLAIHSEVAVRLIPALRQAGVETTILGGDSMASTGFFDMLIEEAGGGQDPDEITANIYASAPLILDALSGDAVRWLVSYADEYGEVPQVWHGATAYDAAVAIVSQLGSGGLELDDNSRVADRERLHEALIALDSPEQSIHGIVGPIWFTDSGAGLRPLSVGIYEEGRFVSASDQLVPFSPAADSPIDDLTEQGVIVESGGSYHERRQVASVGVNLNEISELNTESQTFTADFFIWLEYSGSDDIADIQFVNAVDPGLSLGEAIRSSESGERSYRLYRVKAPFKSDLNFRDFPFDEQVLTIEIQHPTLPASRLIYTISNELRDETQEDRLTSGTNAAVSINAIPEWTADQVLYSQGSLTSSDALGGQGLSGGQTGISYSELITEVTIGRDVPAFLVKNMLPLLLLALATYTSLWFAPTQTAARVSFGITGILTGAVLLTEVTSSLPNIGYAVAIEWAYYVFILLSAGLVVVGLVGDRLNTQRNIVDLRRLNLSVRIAFPAVLVLTALAYVWIFA